MQQNTQTLSVNGRAYHWPQQPLVVICIDGSEPDYIEAAVAAGAMPFTEGMLQRGTDLRGHCVIPSFTNPNNLSIVTGQPPAIHGLSGNFFYDVESDAAVMMNDPAYLRCPTLFPAFCEAGAKVAIVTAKDKLRRLLGHGLDFGRHQAVCFSAEKADCANKAEHGIDDVLDLVGLPVPSVYSAGLSEFIFAAGVKLMQTRRPELMYLSTTDYIQHKHAPGSAVANRFYQMMDGYWATLEAAGAVLALTADHGMNAKHDTAGQINAVYLQSLLDQWLGADQARVILPITDPYVVHHGALGGYATVHLAVDIARSDLQQRLQAVAGIDAVYGRADAAARFQLPQDRIGDLVILAAKNSVLGRREEEHDLSALTEPLRSHGSTHEQTVPLIFSRALADDFRQSGDLHNLRNFDIFDLALNHLAVDSFRKTGS